MAPAASPSKPLLISDPDTEGTRSVRALSDRGMVEEYLKRELTLKERLLELFSTHPNIVKGLRMIQSFSKTRGGSLLKFRVAMRKKYLSSKRSANRKFSHRQEGL